MLTSEELSLLEEDLKQFLVVNHVYKEEWEEINATNPELAAKLVELFSDSVLQTVYEKIEFLEHRSADSCFVFHCLPDKLELTAIRKKSFAILPICIRVHPSCTRSTASGATLACRRWMSVG